MTRRSVRLAVDIGGTFTDLEWVDLATGETGSFKTPTTPDDFSIGFIDAARGAAARFGFAMDDVRLIVHGTTIATNAVLTRNLPPGAFITTAGFEDVLEIGRHVRKDVYGLKPERRAVLAPRRRRFGVIERMGARGEIVTPLDAASLDAMIDRLAASGAEVAAVCLINAYLNPAHEIAVRDRIAERLPGMRVSCSHEVSPEIREFERGATAMLNALLMPVVQTYIDRLLARIAEAGLAAPLYLLQSNGGVATPAAAAAAPVKLLLSGPAGGVLAAEALCARLGVADAVGVDMGGTSYDVALIQGGRRAVVAQGEIDGLPVRVPMVEMRTIGAGGGSIASVEGGRLKVGPESAGAKPGPVCYGRGGTEPTTTDANLLLGYLSAEGFMRGRFPLDRAAAQAAVERRLAEPLGLTPERAAEGIFQVVNARLAAAIKLSLFERGLDPRTFALMSFGGAGGLHATAVADELGISRVIFPKDPSTFSAHGILRSDIVHDLVRTRVVPLRPGAGAILGPLADALAQEGRRLLTADRLPAAAMELRFSADLRYRGQAFELMLPLDDASQDDATLDDAALAALAGRFHEAHLRRFSFSDPAETVELVALRLAAVGRLGAPAEPSLAEGVAPAPGQWRSVRYAGQALSFVVIEQADLPAGAVVEGPAIVQQEYTSLLLGPGWRLAMARSGDMVAERVRT